MITYIYEMYRGGHHSETESVIVSLARPSWWEDATHHQRRVLEKLAILSDPMVAKYDIGFRVSNVIRPTCECIVQQVEERDPFLLGAGGICNRCHGPLP